MAAPEDTAYYMGPAEKAMVAWLRSALRLPGFAQEQWTEEHDSVAFSFVTQPEMTKMGAYMTADKELALMTPYTVLPVAPTMLTEVRGVPVCQRSAAVPLKP